MTPDLDYRPCGACGSYVPTDTGCGHWKPGSKTGKKVGWVRGRSRGAMGNEGYLPPDSPEVVARAYAVLENGGLTPGQAAR